MLYSVEIRGCSFLEHILFSASSLVYNEKLSVHVAD